MYTTSQAAHGFGVKKQTARVLAGSMIGAVMALSALAGLASEPEADAAKCRDGAQRGRLVCTGGAWKLHPSRTINNGSIQLS